MGVVVAAMCTRVDDEKVLEGVPNTGLPNAPNAGERGTAGGAPKELPKTGPVGFKLTGEAYREESDESAPGMEEENQNWRYVSSLLASTDWITAGTALGADAVEC